ncbi:hypothetical protein [Psychromarinibacter sp. S121]|uniref:hypothetical protein n=1 Tax=Psychromarinibacter sp. S121 TaxID=3415127 RepID=UPI003C7C21AB
MAEGWETFSHDLGKGAAVCPYDDADTGAFFCFAVACLPEGGNPLIRVALGGQDMAQPDVPLSVQVDGKMVSHLFLSRLPNDGPDEDMADFATPFDAARDEAMIAALMAGSRARLIFGTGLAAVIQEISLSGSHAALDEVSAMCGVPALAPEEH